MRNSPRRSAFFAATAAAAADDGPIGFVERLAALPGLVLDVLLGRYDGISRGRVLLMVAAAFYIVSPVDLVPEALLTLPGLADDAVVAGWLVASLFRATTGYVNWRDARVWRGPNGAQVVPGEVVRS
jgi:uncharacterized membrane protein YkvA (DUF1232 family)